jgi:hypothetical protein
MEKRKEIEERFDRVLEYCDSVCYDCKDCIIEDECSELIKLTEEQSKNPFVSWRNSKKLIVDTIMGEI